MQQPLTVQCQQHAFAADNDILSLLVSPSKKPGACNPSQQGNSQPTQATEFASIPRRQHQQQQQNQHSKWANFVVAEPENGLAAAQVGSPTGPPTTPYDSLSQSHTVSTGGAHWLKPDSHAVSGLGGSPQEGSQQDTPSSTASRKPGPQPQPELHQQVNAQQCDVHQQPVADKSASTAAPAAALTAARKPLVPVLNKRQHSVFKPPMLMAGHQQARPGQGPLQQTSSPISVHNAGTRPAFVFDPVHAEARHVAVPTSFMSLHSYKQSWSAAVSEEINVRCETIPLLLIAPADGLCSKHALAALVHSFRPPAVSVQSDLAQLGLLLCLMCLSTDKLCIGHVV